MSDKVHDSIARLGAAMASGTISSEQLVTACLAEIDAGVAHNAFITVDSEGALEQARQCDQEGQRGSTRGPLHGIPLAIKDNIHVAGLPSTGGTAALKDFVPGQDAGVVARLRAAGAIVIGKNNLHELAFGITSNNYTFGAVGNATNPRYIAGGSSGGTTLAVALGMAVAGLGTDTGGSVRIPPALNGVVGFRPTVGRYPADGLVNLSTTRDTVGPITASVADAALLDEVLSGERLAVAPANLAGLRLGVPRDWFFDDLDPEVAQVTEALLVKLRGAGVGLIEEDLLEVPGLNEKVSFPVVLYETGQLLPRYLEEHNTGVSLAGLLKGISSPDVREVLDQVFAGAIPEPVYREALEVHRPALQAAYRGYFSSHRVDAVIFPTTVLPARPIEGSLETVELNGVQVPTFPTYIHNTDPASSAGIPGLTIPAGITEREGLPVGIELDGPVGSDTRLLGIGMAIEALAAEE